MTAPATNTWETAFEDGGARRPSVDDVGGAQLQDSVAKPPPRGGSHLYADMVNQGQKQLASIGRVLDGLRITVDFDGGGAPFIDKIQCPNGNVVPNTDVVALDNGDGDTLIYWDANKLIVPIMCDPRPSLNTVAFAKPSIVAIVVSPPPTGAVEIRVVTKDDGVPTDGRFTVEI